MPLIISPYPKSKLFGLLVDACVFWIFIVLGGFESQIEGLGHLGHNFESYACQESAGNSRWTWEERIRRKMGVDVWKKVLPENTQSLIECRWRLVGNGDMENDGGGVVYPFPGAFGRIRPNIGRTILKKSEKQEIIKSTNKQNNFVWGWGINLSPLALQPSNLENLFNL